jgi:large repetitive protein
VGSDSFTFRAFDGTAYSEEATITINIIATNATPIARESNITVHPDTESELKLLGVDPDGDAIHFVVLTQPLHGELSGNPPNLLYKPRVDYLGPDRFEFQVFDGLATSEPATFNIQVARNNRAPLAVDQVIAVEQNKVTRFDLSAMDPDEDSVQVVILKGPRSGLIYGQGTSITYAPRGSVLGSDSFTYKLWDGQRFGNVGRVTVNISVGGELKPPMFTSIENVDGVMELQLSVSQDRPLRLEASTNLVEWFILAPSTTPTKATFEFQDTNAPATMLYYRAVRE